VTPQVAASARPARLEDGEVDGPVEAPPEVGKLLGEVLRGLDVDHHTAGQGRVEVGVAADEARREVAAADAAGLRVLRGEALAHREHRADAPGFIGRRDEDILRFRYRGRRERNDADSFEEGHDLPPDTR
jgi:hypothetical protein